MLAAARELATAHGYESIRAGDIANAAGVSRETFYTHFADKRSCLAEATEPRLGEIESELRIATEEGRSWAAPILESLEGALLDSYGSSTTPRGRIIEAMLALVAEQGYPSTRLVDVIKQAKVSYPTFYRHFENKQECFAAACESLVEDLSCQLEARGGEAEGKHRLVALAELLAAEPHSARVLALEASQLPLGRARGQHERARGLAGLIGANEPAGTSPLQVGAFLELLRDAALRSRLDDLPAHVVQATEVFGPSLRPGQAVRPPARPRSTALQSRSERRSYVRARRTAPPEAAGSAR